MRTAWVWSASLDGFCEHTQAGDERGGWGFEGLGKRGKWWRESEAQPKIAESEAQPKIVFSSIMCSSTTWAPHINN